MSLEKLREKLAWKLGYPTVAYVIMHDARLGCLYYLMLAVIVFYIVVYHLLYLGGYTKQAVAEGDCVTTVHPPTVDLCDPWNSSCRMNFRNKSDLPYCLESNIGASKDKIVKEAVQLPCRYFDALDLTRRMTGGILLGTYIEEVVQSRLCDGRPAVGQAVWLRSHGGLKRGVIVSLEADGRVTLDWDDASVGDRVRSINELVLEGEPQCNRVWESDSSVAKRLGFTGVFAADVESFTVAIWHSLSVPALGIEDDLRHYLGYLYTDSASMCRTHPNRATHPAQLGEPVVLSTTAPCYIRPNLTGPDNLVEVFTVGAMLEAAQVDLSAKRMEGTVLLVDVIYKNFRPFWGLEPTISYVYKVRHMVGRAKGEKNAPLNNVLERVVKDVHGVEIYVHQSGKISQFSLLQTVLNFAAGLTLATVATVIVDFFGMHLHSNAKSFSRLKYPEVQLSQVTEGDWPTSPHRHTKAMETSDEDS